jgi:hypothetical protein
MEVAERPSALEVAATEDPAPEGGDGSDPAPRVALVATQPMRVALVATQPPRCWSILPLYCFHGRPHWITPSPVRGGCSDARFYGSRWSRRFRGQLARR